MAVATPCENLRRFSEEFRKSRLKNAKNHLISRGTTVAKLGANDLVQDHKAESNEANRQDKRSGETANPILSRQVAVADQGTDYITRFGPGISGQRGPRHAAPFQRARLHYGHGYGHGRLRAHGNGPECSRSHVSAAVVLPPRLPGAGAEREWVYCPDPNLQWRIS